MRRRRGVFLIVLVGVVGLPPSILRPQPASGTTSTTHLASIYPNGQQSGYQSSLTWSSVRFSADNRYMTWVGNFEVSPGFWVYDQVFRRDLVAGTTDPVSYGAGYGNNSSYEPRISADGRYVVFQSDANNFGPTDTNGMTDVYRRDMVTGALELASVSTEGVQTDRWVDDPSMSADGRYVAFSTTASNLVPDDTNFARDVFVRDMVLGTLTRVNLSSAGMQAVYDSYEPVISGNGRHIAFGSWADNLALDLNMAEDIFVRDLQTGQTELVTLTTGGIQGSGDTWTPAISHDGNVVAWYTWRSDYVAGDTNGSEDVFVRDRAAGTTVRASVAATGAENQGASAYAMDPHISADGRYVAFHGNGNIAPDKTSGFDEVFVKDLQTGLVARVAVADGDGEEANDDSFYPGISADGTRVGFVSQADNLVVGDGNDTTDYFVHHLNPIDFITRRPAALFGRRRSGGYANDPVNTATGNFTTAETDLDFPDDVFGMDWMRTYNSRDERFSTLGTGWAPVSGLRLDEQSDGSVVFTDWDGREETFTPADGGYTSPEEVFATLAKAADGTFTLAGFGGTTDSFGVDGRLVQRGHWDGQTVGYAYDGGGRLTSMVASAGHALTFTYDAAGARITRVTADDGRAVDYGYTPGGDLLTASPTDGGTTTYATDDAGRVTAITDPDGVLVISNAYDERGRVVSQGTSSGNTVTFDYADATGRTTVTDTSTGGQTVFVHDHDGRLTGVIDALGQSLSKQYDVAGNLVSVVDRRGATTTQTFDAHGNLLSSSEAGGVSETFAYDTLDRRVSHSNGESETTTLAYDGSERLPSSVTDAEGGVTTFDVVGGLVVSATDADGVATTYAYNGRRELMSATDENGKATTFTYDAAGNEATRRTPLGRTTSFTHDGRGRPLTVVSPTGSAATTTWTPGSRLAAEKDALGNTTTYAYDGAGRVSSATDALGRSVAFAYDLDGNLTSVTKPGGATSTATYDKLGRRTSDTDPAGVTTTYAYDEDGNLTATTDEDGHSVTSAFDLRGRVTSVTDQLGHVTTSTWDKADRLLSVTAPAAGTTSYSYDDVGRVLATTDGRGSTSTTAYTPAGRTASQTDPRNNTTSFGYDALGRRVRVTDPEGGISLSFYDDDGRVGSDRNQSSLWTHYGYDADGRVNAVTSPAGGTTRRTFTARGEAATITDPLGAVQRFFYDAAGRLERAVDANGHATLYQYDVRHNLVSRTDPKGGVERFEYDGADRLTAGVDQLNRRTTVTYDDLGRRASAVDPSGRSVAYTYDAVGRVTSADYGAGATVSYVYDAAGRRTSMTDSTGTSTYTWDATGNPTSETSGGQVTGYMWDAEGNLGTLTLPNGHTVGHTYDKNDRLRSLRYPGTGGASYTYLPDGRVSSVQVGDRFRFLSYDGGGRLATYHETGATSRLTAASYDVTGRMTAETTDGSTRTYSYDPAGQLTGVADSTTTTTYAYDEAGNRVARSEAGRTTRYRYDAAHQLTSADIVGVLPVDAVTFSHDGAGRLTGASSPGTARNFSYDALGHLAEETATAAGVVVGRATRTTDGDGTLKRVVTTGAETRSTDLSWNNARPVPQVAMTTTSGRTAVYVHGRQPELVAYVNIGATRTFARDLRGNVLRTADTAPFVEAERYDEFGVPEGLPNTSLMEELVGRIATGTTPQTVAYGYRGELHTNGLVHLRNRDYAPGAGRFTTQDPLDGQPGAATSTTPYPYAANDPVNLMDPLGLSPVGDGELQWDPNAGLENYLAGMHARSAQEQLGRALAATNATLEAAYEMKWLAEEFFRTIHEQNMAARRGSSATFGDYWEALKSSTYYAGKALWDTAAGIAELLANPTMFIDGVRAAYRELGLLGAVNQFNPAYHMLQSGNAYIEALRNGDYDQASYYATRLVMDAAATITAASAVKSALTTLAATTAGLPTLITTRSALEAKFKHAPAFGITETRSASAFSAFERALHAFVENSATKRIRGTYRGQEVILNYNEATRQVVVQAPDGTFVSGWRMSPEQLRNVVDNRSLGGG